MKKITFTILVTLASLGSAFSQAIYTGLNIPFSDGNVSAFRGPNGTAAYAYQRSIMLIHEWEMLPMNQCSIKNIKFNYNNSAALAPVPSPGNIMIYMSNTNDQTYLASSNWATAIAGMGTALYNGPFQVPSGVGAANGIVPITLTTPFNYTGGGLYLAWDYTSTGPNYSTNAATLTSNGIYGMIYFNSSTTPGNVTLGTGSIFRPVITFSAANTATNDIEVVRILADANISKLEQPGQPIKVQIVNSGTAAVTNVSVNIAASGANVLAPTQSVVASIGAGQAWTVIFPGYVVTMSGVSTITAAVTGASGAFDSNPFNNAKTFVQTAGCSLVGMPQSTVPIADYLSSAIGNGVITSFAHISGTAPSSLQSISVVIPSFANAMNLGAVVFPVLLNSTGAVVASGNNLTIGAGDMDVWKVLTFPTPVNLTPNTAYFFGVGTTGTGYFPIAYSSNGPYYYVSPASSWTLPGYYQMALGGGVPNPAKFGSVALQANIVTQGTAVNLSASSIAGCLNPPNVVTLTASGSGNYVWSVPGTGAVITVTPTGNTVINVTGTEPISGCTGSASISYTAVSVAITAAPATTTICKGKKVVLTASGAATYSWSGSTGTIGSNTVTPAVTTSYSVYGTEPSLGCKSNTVVLAVTISPCTGILVNGANSDDINIFPNPATNGRSEITGLSGVNTITIYNLLGQLILTDKTEKENYTLDFSNQPNGTYLVKIVDSNNDPKLVKVINQN